MDLELSNHVAVITGGASGIGEACARGLAAEGAEPVVWDIAVDENGADDPEMPLAIRTARTSWRYPGARKRATITLPDDLERVLERFVEEQEVPVQLTTVVQTAVREYLSERGYLRASSALRIRAAAHGSGENDGSVSHDRYLASK